MILMVSGRTDIVAFYSQWFIERYKQGFVDVRNPFYHQQVSRINFKNVDLIVFCTKNPLPIIEFLPQITQPIIFQITLTAYQNDIEVNVINKKLIIEGIKKISQIIGPDNLYLRYDPVFINEKYSLNYHITAFEKLTTLLKGYLHKIIISFLDDYQNVRNNIDILNPKTLTEDDYQKIGTSFYQIAKKNNMTVQTCSEQYDLSEYGFLKDACLSQELAYQITKKKYKKWNARNSPFCNCAQMVDIGAYNTCFHLCKYCYANFDEKLVAINIKEHQEKSSLLIGKLTCEDIIKERL